MGLKYLTITILLLAGGCARPWSMAYSPGEPLDVAVAPGSGQYELYAQFSFNPCHSARLFKGERIGFAVDDAGKIVAVAGADHWEIANWKYRWILPGSEKNAPSGSAPRKPSHMEKEIAKVAAGAGGLLLATLVDVAVELPFWALDALAEDSGGQSHEHSHRPPHEQPPKEKKEN
jgi:hypothetical protein